MIQCIWKTCARSRAADDRIKFSLRKDGKSRRHLCLALAAPTFFFTFSLSRGRRPAPSRTWDKSRVRDLSALLDHSNVRDRTGGKLSVSTGLQPVNGWHSICSRGFSGAQPVVRSKIRAKIQSRVLHRCIYRKREALRRRINGIMMDPLRPVEIHYCSENRLLTLNLNSWFPSGRIVGNVSFGKIDIGQKYLYTEDSCFFFFSYVWFRLRENYLGNKSYLFSVDILVWCKSICSNFLLSRQNEQLFLRKDKVLRKCKFSYL